MASNPSFDISTGADLQEVDNAVNQAVKEIAQRYDFKGTTVTIEFDRTTAELKLAADDGFRTMRMADLFRLLVAKGTKIEVVYVRGHWLDVDDMHDVVAASNFGGSGQYR